MFGTGWQHEYHYANPAVSLKHILLLCITDDCSMEQAYIWHGTDEVR